MSSPTLKSERPSTPDGSIVDYELEEQKNDSDLRVLWSKVMDQGPYKSPSTYRNVEALFLCWADNSNDMTTGEEVNRLKSVFENRFNYHVQVKSLDNHVEQKLQVQINKIVAVFVAEHDKPNTLLIVYYAGHGRPGEYYGSLELFGSTSPNDTKKRLDRMVWNKTEDLLKVADSDVLEIFDCCYAGNLALTRGEHRLFEFLAATKELGKTPVPGPDSFTSALTWALEALVEEKGDQEGRFTTDELLRKIQHDAPDFPEGQEPVLSNRKPGDTSAGRIMLHPLDRNGTKAQSPAKEGTSLDLDQAKRQTLTLHLDFAEKPSNVSIETLGYQLNGIFDPNTLGVNRVRFGSLRSSVFNRATKRFAAVAERHRRSSGRQQQPFMDTLHPVPCPTLRPLPTEICTTSKDEGINTSDSFFVVTPVSTSSNEDFEDQNSGHSKKRKHF